MAQQQIVAEAIIKAVDQFSGPLKAMMGQISGVNKQVNQAVNTAQQIPSALLGGFMMGKEYEYDKLLTRFQAITEMPDKQLADLTKRLGKISNEYGIDRVELLQAATGWKEAGANLDDFTRSLENYAKVARITGTTVRETALETRGLMLAFGQDPSDPKKVQEMEEFFLVASKNIKGGAHALIEILKNAAPIAAKLNITKEQIAALASVGVAEGFQPGEIGRALKTVPMRLVAPTKQALAAMRAANIDMQKLYGIDVDAAKDSSPLERRLQAAGLNVTDQVREVLHRELTEADFSGDLSGLQDKLTKDLAEAFEMKKGDATNRRILAAAIDAHFKRTAKGLDVESLYQFKNLSLAELSPILGKEHAAKFIAMFNNKKLAEQIEAQIQKEAPGSILRKWQFAGKGFSFEIDRIRTALENLWGSAAASGIKGDFSRLFHGLADGLTRLQSVDPGVLKAITFGLAGMAVLGPGLALVSASLRPLLGIGAAFMASPFWLKVLAGGGIAALLFGGIGELGQLADPFSQLLTSATGAANELGSALGVAYKALLDLVGVDANRSLLGDSLTALAGTIKVLALSLDLAAATIKGLTGKDTSFEKEQENVAKKWGVTEYDKARELRRIRAAFQGKTLEEFDRETMFNFRDSERRGLDVAPKTPSVLDIRSDVKGTVEGTMKLDVNIKVDGNGQITDQKTTGGEIKGKLDNGQSMPDIAPGIPL